MGVSDYLRDLLEFMQTPAFEKGNSSSEYPESRAQPSVRANGEGHKKEKV